MSLLHALCRDHHNGLLSKYKATWECYEAKYQTRPLAMEVSQKRKTVEDARRKGETKHSKRGGVGLSGHAQIALRVIEGNTWCRWDSKFQLCVCWLE